MAAVLMTASKGWLPSKHSARPSPVTRFTCMGQRMVVWAVLMLAIYAWPFYALTPQPIDQCPAISIKVSVARLVLLDFGSQKDQ